MKIATWNVNSVKARLPRVLEWLEEFKPDVALLQEIKTEDHSFPTLEIESLGYKIATHGQKSYNGVAILSRHHPMTVTQTGLPGDDTDDHARYLEAIITPEDTSITPVRVATIYLPNGNPSQDETGANSDKYRYKLRWMERLIAHTEKLLKTDEAFVLGGDYNVCPTDGDVYDPRAFAGDALCRPETRVRFRALVNLGLTNAFRVFHKQPNVYSYWDYQRGAWPKDNGLLIDYLLLSPEAADRLSDADIDKKPRGQEKASDHTPVWCTLAPGI